ISPGRLRGTVGQSIVQFCILNANLQPLAAATRPALTHNQRDVVVLVPRAELADLAHDSRQYFLRREAAMAIQRIGQALLAVLLSIVVERFRHAVGIKREDVAGTERTLVDRTVPIFEEPQYGAGGWEAVEAAVVAQEERAQVAAIGVAQAPL